MNKMELIENKFDEICERDCLNWWELFDSRRFDEVEDYADSLNLNKQERKDYNDWCNQMGEDL